MFKKLFSLLKLNKQLAMDLGTANTLLATPKEGIVLNQPSVVALDAKTNQVLAVGKEAKEFLGRTPQKITAIRPLKDGVIADFEVTKAMIIYFLREVMTGLRLMKPDLVIGVPAGITQVEKKAVIEAGLQSGAKNVRLIEEPMAAAIGAGMPTHEPIGNMVVDIGGGTTEVAVISLNAVAYAESVRVAGDEMNEAIQRYVQEEFQILIGENMAEEIKIKVGSAFPLLKSISTRVMGKYILDGTPKSIEITDAHVREAIEEPVNVILASVRRALEKTPPELVGDIVEKGILLAGGGALLRGLDQRISKAIGVKVKIDSDPLTTVVRGAEQTLLDEKHYQQVFIN